MSWILTILFLFAIAIFIGLVLRGIDRAWRGAPTQAAPAPVQHKSGSGVGRGAGYLATGAVLGAAAHSTLLADDDRRGDDSFNSMSSSTADTSGTLNDDLIYNPIYAHLPINIYYHSLGPGPEIDSGPDYIHDPIYSHMPGNIYYTDDTPISSFDDDWSSPSSSSFDNDWSSSSSSFDDDWSSSSSSFDDW